MQQLNNEELLDISGGVNWSGTFINSIAKAINTIANLGRSVGTAIRRIGSGNLCPY